MDDIEPYDDREYESGPFCRHWSSDGCDVNCARCGGNCWTHDHECSDCDGWVEPD